MLKGGGHQGAITEEQCASSRKKYQAVLFLPFIAPLMSAALYIFDLPAKPLFRQKSDDIVDC